MEQTYTLQQLRRDICLELQMPFFKRYGGVANTADTGTSSTLLVDAALTQTDDYWAGHWLYHIPTQSVRLITTFNAGTDTLIPEQAVSAMTNGDAYEIQSIWNAADIHRAINRAIEMDGKAYPETVVDTSLVICEDKLEYDLSTLTKKPWIITKIWLERITDVMRGTATAGGASSITDSNANFTGVDTNWMVSIYFGTGKGQVRSVSSLTGLTTINTTSPWTTQPDSTSRYAVWNPTRQVYDWFRLRVARFDTKEFPDTFYLRNRYPSLYGMRMRIEYIASPSVLSLEADTTIVPREYLVARVCSILHGQAIGDSRYNRDLHYAESERYKARADEVLARYHPHVPDVTIWTDAEFLYTDQNDPLGWFPENGQ